MIKNTQLWLGIYWFDLIYIHSTIISHRIIIIRIHRHNTTQSSFILYTQIFDDKLFSLVSYVQTFRVFFTSSQFRYVLIELIDERCVLCVFYNIQIVYFLPIHFHDRQVRESSVKYIITTNQTTNLSDTKPSIKTTHSQENIPERVVDMGILNKQYTI